MKVDDIREAVSEAQRFLRRAEAALNKSDSFELDDGSVVEFISGPRETGALRRSSLDLTRQLAKMRASR